MYEGRGMQEARRLQQDKARHRHSRQLTVLISLCAALVILASLEAALLAGPEAFQAWQEFFPQAGTDDYSAFILTRFLLDILVPAALSLYTYFTIKTIGTPFTYRLIWGAVILITAMWKFLTFETSSPAWYLALLLLAGLFLVVINIHRLRQE